MFNLVTGMKLLSNAGTFQHIQWSQYYFDQVIICNIKAVNVIFLIKVVTLSIMWVYLSTQAN